MLLRKQMEVHGNILFKYRGELPIILIPPALVLLYLNIKSTPEYDWAGFLSWYKFVCLGVVVLGQFIRAWALGFVAPNTSGRNIAGQIADVVNTTGLYSIVRHPLYLGNFFMALGVAMLSCNAWYIFAFTLLFWIYYERIIYAEEHFISAKFNEKLVAWSNRVNTFLPSLKHYEKSDRVFNGKKILRQEMNGVLATFTIFFIFLLIENFAIYQKAFIRVEFWTIAFVASAVGYLVVRYLRKNTQLLSDPG